MYSTPTPLPVLCTSALVPNSSLASLQIILLTSGCAGCWSSLGSWDPGFKELRQRRIPPTTCPRTFLFISGQDMKNRPNGEGPGPTYSSWELGLWGTAMAPREGSVSSQVKWPSAQGER